MTNPIIGITSDSNGSPPATDGSFSFYSGSVEKAGGNPLGIFYSESTAGIGEILDGIDGLLLSGGDDLDPALYGQAWNLHAKRIDPRRQNFELALVAEAQKRQLPILGICLGCQLLNVLRGGSLVQFLPDFPRPGALEHRKVNNVLRRHDVTIERDSILGRTIGTSRCNVNTYHKQAVDQVGRGLRVVARADDGVIEALEDESMPLFLGVQWHPERISDEPEQLALFRLLVDAATSRRTAASVTRAE